jgi:molybdopterin synthase sulfur carrier subunit
LTVRLVYFASVREAIGIAEEQRELPPELMTVHNIVRWLSNQSPAYASAFVDTDRLRFALDQNMVTGSALIGNGTELAIFPPVTGG